MKPESLAIESMTLGESQAKIKQKSIIYKIWGKKARNFFPFIHKNADYIRYKIRKENQS